jgi:hypothetical protein
LSTASHHRATDRSNSTRDRARSLPKCSWHNPLPYATYSGDCSTSSGGGCKRRDSPYSRSDRGSFDGTSSRSACNPSGAE